MSMNCQIIATQTSTTVLEQLAPIDYIHSDEFALAEPDAFHSLEVGEVLYEDGDDAVPMDIDAGGDFETLRNLPILSAAGETFLFRKMNFLKYRAEQFRLSLAASDEADDVAREIRWLLQDAETVRNHIAECNLRLVISLARKFATGHADFDELMSEGNEILLKAISKFDYSRGFRFSTYAVHSVQRHYFRYLQRGLKRQQRERRTSSEMMQEVPEGEVDVLIQQWVQEEGRMGILVGRMAECLDERERFIVVERFGLDGGSAKSLRELSEEMKLSKERIRQLQIVAVEKLRDVFQAIPSAEV